MIITCHQSITCLHTGLHVSECETAVFWADCIPSRCALQEAGFVASSAGLFIGCGFNILTGLLLAEVNLKVMTSSQRKEGVSFRTMASITLGDSAASVISAVYVAFSLLLLNACEFVRDCMVFCSFRDRTTAKQT